jgi:two-component system, NtrC family, response regulator AtoC
MNGDPSALAHPSSPPALTGEARPQTFRAPDAETASEAEIHVFLGMPALIQSQPMRRLLAMAERAGRSGASVLITGESGTGKELIARAIHHYSMRSTRPFVDLNCAALPDLLIESELFGYERGAFSGAIAGKPGLFELAHTGSIFLDEIAELPPRMQVKLLRVLDGAPYYRLGGVKKVSADARIIAATNQDLEQALSAGTFRRDLYHRLRQIRLHVPPLAEHREDIRPLARFFLAQQGANLRFSVAALDALERHGWPGNVRELRNVVLQAAALAEHAVIEPADIGLPASATESVPGPVTLEEMEREMILKALAGAGGRQQYAADSLGISLRTLSRKLKQYEEENRSRRADAGR